MAEPLLLDCRVALSDLERTGALNPPSDCEDTRAWLRERYEAGHARVGESVMLSGAAQAVHAAAERLRLGGAVVAHGCAAESVAELIESIANQGRGGSPLRVEVLVP